MIRRLPQVVINLTLCADWPVLTFLRRTTPCTNVSPLLINLLATGRTLVSLLLLVLTAHGREPLERDLDLAPRSCDLLQGARIGRL